MKKPFLGFLAWMKSLFVLDDQIYVGCALTGTPQEFRDSIQLVKDTIRRRLPGWRVLEFLGLEKGTARDVLRYDLGCVASARLFAAFVDKASTGLGMELQHGAKLGIPIIILAHRDSVVTRMVLGLAEEYPTRVRVERYESLTEVPAIVENLVRQGFYRKPLFGRLFEAILPQKSIESLPARPAVA